MALSFIGLIFNDKSYFNYFRCAQFYQFETSNMNKLFTQVLLAGFFLSAGSAFGQVIKSKDGKVIGTQKEIVDACVASSSGENVQLNNIQINIENYCTCMAKNVLPNLVYEELQSAIEDNSLQALLLREDNLKLLMECSTENITIDSAFAMSAQLNQTQLRPFFVKTCVNGIFMDEGVEEFISKEQASQICNCALDKLIEKGYAYGQISALSDTGSPEFEEIMMGCLPAELLEEMNEEE